MLRSSPSPRRLESDLIGGAGDEDRTKDSLAVKEIPRRQLLLHAATRTSGSALLGVAWHHPAALEPPPPAPEDRPVIRIHGATVRTTNFRFTVAPTWMAAPDQVMPPVLCRPAVVTLHCVANRSKGRM